MSEIKACPFVCGGGVERNSDKWGHYYVCDCGAHGPYGDSPATALERWNTRPPSQPGRDEIADSLKRNGFTSRDGTYLQGGTYGVIDAILSLNKGTVPGAVQSDTEQTGSSIDQASDENALRASNGHRGGAA